MNRFSVKWSPQALNDLREVHAQIAEKRPEVAAKIYRKLKESCRSLCQFPDRGRIVPEIIAKTKFSYREIIVAPWRVIYRISSSKVLILAIFDSRRDAVPFFKQRGFENQDI